MNSKNITRILTCGMIVLFIGLASCVGGDNHGKNEDNVRINERVDSLSDLLAQKDLVISQLRDSIAILRFPAPQRLEKIKQLIDEKNFQEAKIQIAELEKIFPDSPESKECMELTQDIDNKLAEIEAENQRIKALGFKALQAESKVTVGDNTVTFSNIKIDKEFIHDVYPTYVGSEWIYNTADRDCKFIIADMSVTSTSKDPKIPTLAFYTIKGDKLELQGTFIVEMARWEDYGSYLGNYADTNNDFAKVSTVKFKLGCELPETDFSKPYIVVLKKANTQERYYDRFGNPPVSYSGSAGYPATLSLEDFATGGYAAVKIANL